MSKIKSITSAVTAAVLVSGIGFAWAQSETQQQSTNSTTAAGAMPSEQTPADPNAAPLNSSTAMPQQGAATTPPPVDSTTPAPQSSDANSQAPLSTATSTDNSSSTASTTTDSSTSYEPAPRADRN